MKEDRNWALQHGYLSFPIIYLVRHIVIGQLFSLRASLVSLHQ